MSNTSHTYHPHTIVVIAGPTASGKTACAIETANHFNTVILSADSRQCYKELNVGVARPSFKELDAVPHYFIASNSVTENINAAKYETYALQLLKQLFKNHSVVIVTGGTGLYIKALTDGLDAIPEIDDTIRSNIIEQYQKQGISWLKQQLELHDNKYTAEGEMQNPQRMMRALEVVLTTGKSIIDFYTKNNVARPFNIIKIGLEWPRDVLYERINQRVDAMMETGLEDEAKQLIPYKNLNALQTVGYKELFDYFDGHISLETAVEKIKQNTRRYAKRQMTWFKKQSDMHWINAAQPEKVLPAILDLYQKLATQETKNY